MICNAAFPEHAAACALPFTIAIGDAGFGPSWDALVAEHMGEAPAEVAVERDDPCWFFFTSGTTGRPKASVLTHGQMAFVVTNHLCDLMPGLTSADASLVVAPLSHGAGVHQLAQVARGVKTVLMPERFDVATAWQLIEHWRISTMFTVPTILKLLVEHESAGRFDHSSLRYVIYAGAPMYREDQKRALRLLGPVLVQYFGLGEVTGAITVLPARLHAAEDGPEVKLGTCGYDRTAMQLQVQGEAGKAGTELEAGERELVDRDRRQAGQSDRKRVMVEQRHAEQGQRKQDEIHRDPEEVERLGGAGTGSHLGGGGRCRQQEHNRRGKGADRGCVSIPSRHERPSITGASASRLRREDAAFDAGR